MQGHWFWSVAKKFWENYSHVAIAAFIVNMLALAAPIFTMNVYDRVVPNGAIPSLVALAIGMVIAIVFDFVLRMVRSRIVDVTGKKIDVVLAAKIFEHVQSVKMAQRPLVGRRSCQSAAGLRFRSRILHLRHRGLRHRSAVRVALHRRAVYRRRPARLDSVVIMLPIMIVVGFLLQRPLDRGDETAAG